MSELLYKEEAYKVIGACMTVHRELGHGFLEAIYQEALARELEDQKIPFEREQALTVLYKDKPLNKKYFADFICYDSIIIETKAVKALTDDMTAQLFNYLKATRLQLGLLVNFGTPSLEQRRIVCSSYFSSNSQNPQNPRSPIPSPIQNNSPNSRLTHV
jgi:GxxExxY protein